MGAWLAERTFGEIVCLLLTAGMVVAGILRALSGKGA